MDHVGIVTPLSDLTTVGGTFNGDTLIRINQPITNLCLAGYWKHGVRRRGGQLLPGGAEGRGQ